MFEAFGTESSAGADAASSLNFDPSPACGCVAMARPVNRRLTGGPPVRRTTKPRGMTCDRRPAGARSRLPRPRQAPRVSLLPALALLLGALPLFAPAPTEAQGEPGTTTLTPVESGIVPVSRANQAAAPPRAPNS